ncbi:MAG: hypothetical protein NZM06_11440 [Chloroherpetonaceae bacterium]|nr:hypothetical protein [Chloroherpetonaceae bacterium]MDW8438306.1 hypothetical protein [Chloroherpetonaceae bacterium]
MASRFKLAIVRSAAWLVAPLVSLALSLALTQVPLFNALGYESSLAFGIVLPFFVGGLAKSELPKAAKFSSAFFALLAPPVVMLVNMLFARNCSYLEGLGFYALSAVAGSAFAYALMRFLKSLSETFARALYASLYAGILILPTLYRFCFSPQIFFFNHIFGFFSGAIYDDAIELEWRYALFRIETLLLTAFLLLYSFREKFSRRDLVVLTICFGPLLLPFELGSDEFGFTSSRATLAKRLAPIDDDGLWRMSVQSDSLSRARTRQRLEQELRDLQRALALDALPKISIFIYPNAEEKRRYTGAENVEFAKPWRGEIHITEQSFGSTIRHELVHALMARYGVWGLGLSRSVGLLEGVAVAFETPDFDWTTSELAAALLKNDLAPKNLESLLGAFGFWTSLGATSYALMGSFARYLVESYGIEKFKAVYADADFMRVYGKSASGLIAEWKEFLATQDVPPALDSAVAYRFKRKTIFQTECPHRVAVELKRGSKALAEKRYDEAQRRFQRALSLTEGKNPRAVQGHFSARLLKAVLDSLPLAAIFREADSLARRLDKPEPTLFSLANAMLWTGYGSPSEIDSLFKRVQRAALSFNYDYAIALRLEALAIGLNPRCFSPLLSPAERDSILNAALAETRDSTARAFLNFLKAERLLAKGDDDGAIRLLQTLPPLRRDELEFQRRFDSLEALLRLGRTSDALKAIADAKACASRFVAKRAKEEAIDALVARFDAQRQ